MAKIKKHRVVRAWSKEDVKYIEIRSMSACTRSRSRSHGRCVRKSATKRMLSHRIDTAKERLCTRIALLQALSETARSCACCYCYMKAVLQTRRSFDGRAMGM